MFDILVKILTIVFNPLFQTTSEAIRKRNDPRRQMVKALLQLYENLEGVEFASKKFHNEVEGLVKTNWLIKPRHLEENLSSRSSALHSAVNNLHSSISSIYRMLDFERPDILVSLCAVYEGKHQLFNGKIFALPEIQLPNLGKENTFILSYPTEELLNLDYKNLGALQKELAQDFLHNSKKLHQNLLLELNMNDKKKIMELLVETRPRIEQIANLKEALKSFIKEKISIEDFFM